MKRMGFVRLLVAVGALCVAAQAQAVDGAPTKFEVASVRPDKIEGPHFAMSPPGAPQFTAKQISLTYLIILAYGLDNYQLEKKSEWMDNEFFDVDARVEGDAGLSYEQLRLPLQQLLKERFHLAVHRETKSLSGYELVVAKDGPKLTPTEKKATSGYMVPDGLVMPGASVSTFASMLSYPLRVPVVDKTGITGNYDFKLKYAPEGAADSTLPSVFTAVQEQLGLKLQSAKVPVEMVVIDHVDRVPTEN